MILMYDLHMLFKISSYIYIYIYILYRNESDSIYIYIYIYIYVCVCVLFGPVKAELGVVPSGQENHSKHKTGWK